MRTVKALVGLDSVVVCEAPGESVQPVLCLEGGVLLPSPICHTFQASWHLCAPRAVQAPACGLFSWARNVLKMKRACQAAFFIWVLDCFIKRSRPSPLPQQTNAVRLHMLGGGEVKHSGWLVQVTSPAWKQTLSYWLHQPQ